MKALVTVAVVGLLALMGTSNSLSAQSLFLGVGGTSPTSDYGEYAKTGYLVLAGGAVPVGQGGVSIGIEGFYGQNSHEVVDGDKTNPYGALAMLQYSFSGRDADATVYVLLEGGMLWHKFSSDTSPEDTESGFGYGGAAGYAFPLGGVQGWIEGRFNNASISDSNTAFYGLVAGISIGLGN
jgi:hypothetical protein